MATNKLSVCGQILGAPACDIATGCPQELSLPCGVVGAPVCVSSDADECPMPLPPGGGEISQPFDFAVIRYRWDFTYGGQDLDTRTTPMNLPGYSWDMVGWNRLDLIGPSGDPFLRWGGDNTGAGVEAVLINFLKMSLEFPAISEFRVNLRAFWFNSRAGGNIELELAMYKGGQMVPSGYDFVNEGGELVATWFASRNIFEQESNDITGEDAGELIYDAGTYRARLRDPRGIGAADPGMPEGSTAMPSHSITGNWGEPEFVDSSAAMSTPQLTGNWVIVDYFPVSNTAMDYPQITT